MGRHRVEVSGPGMTAFVVCLALGPGAGARWGHAWPAIAGGLVGAYLLFA